MITVASPRSSVAALAARPHVALYRVLLGLCALSILLQALWAGIFLEHDGQRDAASSWIDVHARGGEVALGLAALATVVAFIRLRQRKDLWVGTLLLTALLVLESYVGGQIRDNGRDTLTALHVPLAMALMSLAVWLAARAAPAWHAGAGWTGRLGSSPFSRRR